MEKRIFTSLSLKRLSSTAMLFAAFCLFGTQIFSQGLDCGTATPIVAGSFTASGPASGAGASNTCVTSATNANWYSFTATADGTLTASSDADPLLTDTRVSILSGACGALVCEASDDDGGAGFTSIVSTAVKGGNTYFIEWDDRWSTNGFDWVLSFAPAVAPMAGEGCTTALAAAEGANVAPALSGTFATNECFGSGATSALWYTFTPTACGTIDVTSTNDPAQTDTRLSIYDGSCANSSCPTLNCLGNDDDGGAGFTSQVLGLDVVGGTTYYIEWDDRWSTNGFTWELTYTLEVPVITAVNSSGGTCGGGGIPTIEIVTEAHCGMNLEYSIDNGATFVSTSTFADQAYDNMCFDIVVRDADNISNSVSHPDMVCFNDLIPPVAVCQDADVTLVNGVASIVLADVDGGSTDNCGIDFVASSVSPSTFDCSNVGPVTVTVTIVDELGGLMDDCTATVNVFADGTCSADIGNEGGPSIADPCTCSAVTGLFDEEVFLQSTNAGQAWTITDVSGFNTFAVGDLMTDNGDGTYSLVGTHADGVGYSVTVESDFFPDVELQVGNTCFYPAVAIENDFSIVCANSPLMTLSGNAGGVDGTPSFTVNGAPATELDPAVLGLGTHTVEFCFDAGTATGTKVVNGTATNSDFTAMADPGCVSCISEVFVIGETPSSFSCNDKVQISANIDCETEITPDMIMEGGSGFFCYDDYTVTLTNVPNPVTTTYFGRDIVAMVTHIPSGNKCWGTVVIEDKLGPKFDCTVAITNKMGDTTMMGQTIDIDCEIDPANIPAPASIDNCDPNPYVSLVSEVETGDKCAGITLTRVYSTSDHNGNQGNNCTITINIAQPDEVRFPEDVTWTCQQYEAYNSIVDPSAMHALIIANAASMDQANYCNIAGTDGDQVAGVDPYGVPTNLISNGGFENGDVTDWVFVDQCNSSNGVITGTYDNGFGVVSPTEGTSMLVNEFNNPAGNPCAIINQRFNIAVPTGASTISFDYNAAWDLTCAGCLPKLAFFEIIEPGVGLIFQDRFISAEIGTTNSGSWNTYSRDLSAFAGKNVFIQFVVALAPGASSPGHFALDNIQLSAGGSTPYWNDGEALDVVLDPLYDDFLQNPITDNNPACDNVATETDSDDCLANFGYFLGAYLQDCNLDPGGHVPNNIKTPIYVGPFAPQAYPNNHPVRGLEDNDVLAETGSGVPSVSADGLCAFAVTHEDQRLEACSGADSTKVFKILRTWTVLNWCTGVVSTDVQVIKVLDKKAPVIFFDDDDNADGINDHEARIATGITVSDPPGNLDGYRDFISSDQFANSSTECGAGGLIDVPTFTDDCTGVINVRVYTPVGEALPVEVAGQVIGYRIPSPYLKRGGHFITFEASDACGNTTITEKRIVVQDGIPPVNICREFTQVSLSAEVDGIAELTAEHFNEASYDNCGPVYFKVRRMDDNCTGFNTDRTRFNDDIRFCCSDIGDTLNVILRAYDVDPGAGSVTLGRRAANSNDCMVRVLVEDKSRPTCAPPEDVWINCDVLKDNIDFDDTDQLSTEFGTAEATDNCGASITELTPQVDVDLCGIGTVVRRFRAEDDFGNRSLGTCEQTIMIMPVNEYTLTIPGDFEEECDDASPATLTYTEVGCDLLAVNIEDEEFPASSLGECKKIIRTYQVINWCLYDGQSDPVIIPRLDINNDGSVGDGNGGSRTPTNHSATNDWISTGGNLIFIPNPLIQVGPGGYYQYEQHIKIYDNTAPEVSYDGDTQFCGGDLDQDPCTGPVTIEVDTDDLCTGTDTRWELSAFATQFTAPDFSGTGILTGRYPLGTHTARFYVSDECGNTSEYDVTFEVIDCKAPTPVCYNGLSIDVMPLSGMVEIWAEDFDASSFDYCHPLKYAINRVTDLNGDGFIDANDYQTTVPAFDSVQFVCADAGDFVFVQLWVGEVSSDDVNNWDYCVTTMEVQDNNGVCNGSRSSIAGTAKTAAGQTVTNVDVTISGAMDATLTTTNDGAFGFNNLVTGNDYTVTPMRTDEVTNGVSTFDLTVISKHILNVEPFTSPYKMIAADANNSGKISTLDLVAIRKVILRTATEFPNNTSWRFIDKDQILDANPLGKVINEVKSFNNIDGNLAADFIAVKVGDVNNDAEPQQINGVDGRTFNGTFYLNAKDAQFEAGDRVEVAFTSEELSQIEGYQFTLNFNTEVVELAEVVDATSTQENFGLTMVDKGIVTTSWNGNATTDAAFTLVFVAKTAGTMSNVLSVSSEFTTAEAYSNGTLKNVGFNFGTTTATADFALYQNTPNPFENETSIGFNLPEATSATITLTDISGKVLRVIQGDYAKGYNQISLEMTSNMPSGVVIYELETSTNKATRKMTVVK